MSIYRRLLLAVLLLALISSAPVALTDTPLLIRITADNSTLDSHALSIFVDGVPAEYMDNGTYMATLASIPNEAMVKYKNDTYNATLAPDMSEVTIDLPLSFIGHTVTGTIYAGDVGWQQPWADEWTGVTVNGNRANVSGNDYSILLLAPDSADIDVKVIHEDEYVLSEKITPLNSTSNVTEVNMLVRPLCVSGDVYYEGVPVDEATLFIYVKDRQYGPITATPVYGEDGMLSYPMFTAYVPGAHPGDSILLTCSSGGKKGEAVQDTIGDTAFLTINLKETDLSMSR